MIRSGIKAGTAIKIWAVLFLAAGLGVAGPSAKAQADKTEPWEKPDDPGRVRLVLPPVIYAAPGIEMNIYFRNVCLVLNPANYVFDVHCPKGLLLQERWAYTPQAGDAGDYPITVEVIDENNEVIARASSIVRVAPSNAGTEGYATLLIIGASFTEYSIYPQHVLDLSVRDPYVLLKLVGSRGPDNRPPTGELRHEGYSGWTAQAFATLSGPLSRSGYHKRPATGSPFVYEDENGQPTLDFARYCEQFNAGQGPDFVTIQVGTNDTFTATDQTIDARIDDMLGYYDQLVQMIRDLRPETKIGAVLITPPSTSQDGFRNYIGAGKQTRWQFRRNQHRVIERMIEHYGGRESENIYLVPTNINLDAEHHFPTWTAPRNARSTEKVMRVNNGTHPDEAGYRQIGDVIYSWIKVMLASESESRAAAAQTP